VTHDAGTLLVAVSDTGPGIALDDQARIFEEVPAGRRVGYAQERRTGLGLAIARRIVALHGGRLWVESAPGHGAIFRFTVPVRVERQVEEG